MKVEKKNIIKLLIISFLVIFCFSRGSSPLFGNYYEDDSSIFIVMGKAIVNGFVPYKDIFDHKGPILFWIEALGQLICEGKNGIFLLQVLSLFVTNIFIYKISRMFSNEKESYLSLIFSMSVFVFFIEEGNLSEEFSLPFLVVCLYIGIKWIIDKKCKKIMWYEPLVFGMFFSIISLIRLNNAILIVGLVLSILFILIKKKRYVDIFKCIGYFLVGCLIIYIPVCVYFIINDALVDMIYGTFIHNLMYMNNTEARYMLANMGFSIHIIFLMLIVRKKMKEYNKEFYFTIYFSTILMLLILLISRSYLHYFIITVPVVCVYLSFVFVLYKNKEEYIKSCVIKIIILTCIIYLINGIMHCIFYIVSMEEVTISDVEKLIEQIPEDEKDNIYMYNHHLSSIYIYGDFLPEYKYAFLQYNLIKTNKEIYNEILDYFKSDENKWLITKDIESLEEKNEIILYILDNYEKIDEIEILRLDYLTIVREDVVLYKHK